MSNNHRLATFLKWCIYATAFVPLIIFSQYISPFHFGKVIVFRAMIEIMAVLYTILALREPAYRPRIDKFFWAFLGFVGAFTLTTFTSVSFLPSFWGTLERMGGLFSFWHYFVFYIILTAVLRTREDWLMFLKITVGVGVLSALYGFGQRTSIAFFIGSPDLARIFGTIGNAALFAGYEILNIFLALILGFMVQKKTERNWWFIAAAVMSIAVALTAVRGSILGLSLGLLVFVFLYFGQTHSRRAWQILISLLVLGALFIGFSFAFQNSSFVQNSSYLRRVTDFSPSSTTVQTRFWAWEAGLKGWNSSWEKRLVGWGPENFNIPFSINFNPKFFNGPGSETLFDRAHNMFIEVLVTMGIVGEIAYLWLFITIFRSLWGLKEDSEFRVPAIGLISLTVAYIIHNSFIFDTSANFIVFFATLAFMAHLVHLKASKTQAAAVHGRPASLWVAWTAGILLSCGAVFLVYQYAILPSVANYATTRAIVAGYNNDFTGAVGDYEQIMQFNGPGKYEFRNQFAQYLLDYSTTANTDPSMDDAVKVAITYEQKNQAENPLDYLPDLYLSRLNIILGENDPKSPYNDVALTYSEAALKISPTFVRTYYEVGQAYLNKKDYPDAEAAFQKAADLNPDAGISYWYLGAVQLQAGQTQQGLTNMELAQQRGYSPSESDYLSLAATYIKLNDYPHLVSVYEGLVALVPTNAQYHASLAVAYAKVGRIADAVTQAHDAAADDPSFEPQAQAFVESLGQQW